MPEREYMKKYIREIENCPYGKNCGTCMYRDNRRNGNGFRMDPVDSGEPDHCNLYSGEHDNNG